MMTDDEFEAIAARTSTLWPEVRGSRVFITGGTGFFGCWVLSLMVRVNQRFNTGMRATVLTRIPDRARVRLRDIADNPNVTLHAGDVTTFDYVNDSFDYVFHMAGEPHGPRYAENPYEMADDMVVGIRRVLECVEARSLRKLLFISTGAVYGPQPNVDKIAENTPANLEPIASRRAYADAKKQGEDLALESGVPTIIARPFAFIGPGLPTDASFAASQFLSDGLAGRTIRVRNGNVVRSYLYAADLAEWLWTLLIRGQPGRAYNVGSKQATTLADLARTVADECQVDVDIQEMNAAERYVPNTQRVKDELGLTQTVDLATAVKRTVQWHREQARVAPGG